MWGRSLSISRQGLVKRAPKLLYTAVSPHSGKINVWKQGSERILEVGGYTQSVNQEAENLGNRVWGRMVEELAKKAANPKSVLILGLGGGTIAHLLAERFPGIAIDGVELDPAVVEVGGRYFGLNKTPNLQVIVADAYKLVKNPKDYNLRATAYPMIVVDLFLGGGWSSELDEVRFHQAVKDILAEKGVAVFNRVFGFDRKRFRATLAETFVKIEEVGVRYKSLPWGNTLYFVSRKTSSTPQGGGGLYLCS